MLEIVAGWEPREVVGYQVAEFSAIRRTSWPLYFIPLMDKPLRSRGIYWRPHERRDGQLWCPISEAPMATEFANSRFLVPWLAKSKWSLFCDFADMLFLEDPAKLFELAQDKYAVMVVKQHHIPREVVKMDGQEQTLYERKNWSSVVLWNIDHPANGRLTLDMVNTRPGRELHRFCWLTDEEIGELPPSWNYLVGIDHADDVAPKLLHYTSGLPIMSGYEDGPWSNEWKRELAILDSTRGRIPLQS
jgi:hypothetical protein